MIPPTPTPFTITIGDMPQLEFPDVWALAPDAVQTWNNFGEATTVLQAILLAGLIAAGIYMIYQFLKRIASDAVEVE